MATRPRNRIWLLFGFIDKTEHSNSYVFAQKLAKLTGLPVGVMWAGQAATPLDHLLPGFPSWDATFRPLYEAMGGHAEIFGWAQGEAETLSGVPIDNHPTYAANFTVLAAAFRALPGAHSASPILIRLTGKDGGETNDAAKTRQARNMRLLVHNLGVANPNVYISGTYLGLPMTDELHYAEATLREMARRDALTAGKLLGVSSYDGRGPMVTSATRSSAVITLSLDLNGATSITGAALTGYKVSNDDFTSYLTISSVEVVSNKIVITLAGVPSGTVKVRSYEERNYDQSSVAIGNYADGSTIAVYPIVNPITVT